MKFVTIILVFTARFGFSSCFQSEINLEDESVVGESQQQSTTPPTPSATNVSDAGNSTDYTMTDTATYIRDFMKTMKKNGNLTYQYHPVNTPGVNLKKAAYAPVNNTEINNFRELVRYVLNSRAAPVIKNVLSNLDRDLFKLFTPSDSAKGPTDERLNIIIQHQYPTEVPSNTTVAPSTTSKTNGIRNLEEGEGDDDDDNDDVFGRLSPSNSKYKIGSRVKKTTPKSKIVEYDDEDESAVFNKIKNL